MFKSIWNDIRHHFRSGNMIVRLILVNITFYVAVNLVYIFTGGGSHSFYKTFLYGLSVSSDTWHLLTHPWALATFMFTHEGFFHIFWNMLMLYWFGRIAGDLLGDRRILPLYVLGSWCGFLFYFIFSFFLDFGSYAFGASASVMAVMMAAGVIAPDYRFNLMFIGEVKLKYIVAVFLFLDLIGAAGMINSGGHVGHLGGAFFGWLFVTLLRQGTDLSTPFNRATDWLWKFTYYLNRPKNRQPRPTIAYTNKEKITARNKRPGRASDSSSFDISFQEKLNAILDKINTSGMESLSDEEKEFLFDARNKID